MIVQASAQTLARQALNITPLSPVVGAEIRGLDLRNPIDAATQRLLRQAWHDHAVLLLRDQAISRQQQARFGACFGALQMVRDRNGVEHPYPWMVYVSNIRKDGKPIGYLPDGEMHFHSDQSYIAEPPVGTMLYAIEVPSKGGNTLFASAYAAYEALSDAMKSRLDGLRALHTYDLGTVPTLRGAAPPGSPSFVHPIVRTHPVTGRKVLFVSRLTTVAIEGMDRADADALLEELFAHQEQQRFVYEHVWRPGDVILWDNRCTLHARTDFSPAERRLLRRLVVLRETAEDQPV